jgi:hypothetical protein
MKPRETHEIKNTIVMARAALGKKKALFTSKLNLQLDVTKKLVQCYIWSVALYSAETWTLRKVEQNTISWKVLKCGAGEGWRKSVGRIV